MLGQLSIPDANKKQKLTQISDYCLNIFSRKVFSSFFINTGNFPRNVCAYRNHEIWLHVELIALIGYCLRQNESCCFAVSCIIAETRS